MTTSPTEGPSVVVVVVSGVGVLGVVVVVVVVVGLRMEVGTPPGPTPALGALVA